MPELPLQVVDDLVTEVINDHISKSFTDLHDTVKGMTSVNDCTFSYFFCLGKLLELQSNMTKVVKTETAEEMQEALENNTHFVVAQLQAVMNSLQVFIFFSFSL